MDNQVTDARKPEEKTPEEIEREMERTRESLTQKVAALEQTVTGNITSVTDTVEQVKTAVASVKDSVQDTFSSVKDSLRDSVQTVADTVKETFDISGHVRAKPWLSVGVAAGAGFITGMLLGGRRYSLGASADMPAEQARGRAPDATAPRSAYAAAAEPRKPGIFDELLGMATRELRQVAEMALSSAVAAVKRNVSETVPHLVDEAVATMVPGGHGTTGNGARAV